MARGAHNIHLVPTAIQLSDPECTAEWHSAILIDPRLRVEAQCFKRDSHGSFTRGAWSAPGLFFILQTTYRKGTTRVKTATDHFRVLAEHAPGPRLAPEG